MPQKMPIKVTEGLPAMRYGRCESHVDGGFLVVNFDILKLGNVQLFERQGVF